MLGGGGYTYDPGDRRDPFKSLLQARDNDQPQGPRPEGIPGLLIDEITISGIFHTSRGWVAQVQAANQNKSYLIKVGRPALRRGRAVHLAQRGRLQADRAGSDGTEAVPGSGQEAEPLSRGPTVDAGVPRGGREAMSDIGSRRWRGRLGRAALVVAAVRSRRLRLDGAQRPGVAAARPGSNPSGDGACGRAGGDPRSRAARGGAGRRPRGGGRRPVDLDQLPRPRGATGHRAAEQRAGGRRRRPLSRRRPGLRGSRRAADAGRWPADAAGRRHPAGGRALGVGRGLNLAIELSPMATSSRSPPSSRRPTTPSPTSLCPATTARWR